MDVGRGERRPIPVARGEKKLSNDGKQRAVSVVAQ